MDNIDSLLLDINLSGSSGLGLHSALLKAGKALPNIFISTFFCDAIFEQTTDEGNVGFENKPVDSFVLKSAIQLALAMPHH